jgi:hypothetical protein
MINGIKTASLLDHYNISSGLGAAWSLRKLKTSYNGPCIQVRRSVDNTTQDIGFVNDSVDISSLIIFADSGNAFITKFYDQSDNGKILAQPSLSNQPIIVESGSIILQDGKPAIKFDGINDYLEVIDSKSYFKALHSDKALVGIISRIGYTSDPNIACGLVDTGGALNSNIGYTIFYDDRIQFNRNENIINSISNTNTSPVSIIPNNLKLSNHNNVIVNSLDVSNTTANKRSILKINNTYINNNSNSTNPNLSDSTWNLKAGAVQTNGIINYLFGTIQEVVIYLNDQSQNIDYIKSNMNSYYNIY